MKIPPYIGSNYSKHKILLIGESHYIKDRIDEHVFDNWYSQDIVLPKHISKQFDTSAVVKQFFNDELGTCAIYRFPSLVLSDVLHVDFKQAFTFTAFYNYFQRPNLGKGSFKSIYSDNRDCEFAYSFFKECLSSLSPSLIFFLSKKAFSSYCEHESPSANMHCLVHPASAWWFRNNGKRGAAKMRDILCKTLSKDSLLD